VQGEGPSAQWARRTAQRLKCKVCVGYPEVQHQSSSTTSSGDSAANPVKLYNSLLVVDETGEVVHNYRKRFLYYTDESWASEGEAEWSFKSLGFPAAADGSDSKRGQQESLQIPTTFGICMDINPYKFEAPFTAWEFANRVLDSQSHLVIVSAAWLVTDAAAIMAQPERLPDMDTFNYWLKRFWPLIEKKINYGSRQLDGFCTPTETKVVLVFANRTGAEDGGVGSIIPTATYAGTSTIVAITQKHNAKETPDNTAKSSSSLDIKIHCWGIKGAREEGICFADTASEPEITFVTKKADDDESD
jgi:protein N-terminal amidase